MNSLRLAFLSIHSSPVGKAGSKDTGGMSTYLRGLSAALARKGHRVDIFTRGLGSGKGNIESISPGVRIIYIDDRQGKLDKYELYPYRELLASEIQKLCRLNNLEYDLIYSHYWISGCVGRELKKDWCLPHLIMFHTLGRAKNESCKGENEPPVRLSEEERLAAECEGVIAAACLEKKNILKWFKLPAEKVKVIPPGIDRSLFKPAAGVEEISPVMRESLGGEMKIILAVGRLEPVKGFELALETLASMGNKEKVRLLIIGGDKSSKERIQSLKDKAEELGVGDCLVFAGLVNHENMPFYYRAASATIIPSFYESFGLTALESIACGTPLVAAPVGVVPELFQGQTNRSALGIMIDGREPSVWAGALEELLSQGATVNFLDVNRALKPFDWDLIAENYGSYFSGLL